MNLRKHEGVFGDKNRKLGSHSFFRGIFRFDAKWIKSLASLVLLIQCFLTINSGVAQGSLITSGLILNLDASIAGSYNGTRWSDQSGNNYHAIQQNSPTYNSSDGSFTFNGTNQFFNLGDILNLQSAFSIEVTFSPNSLSGNPALVARQNSGRAGNYFVGISTSKVFYYVESDPWGIRSSSTLSNGVKYTATQVYDSSRAITPYLNGVQDGTKTTFPGSLFTNSINLQIGAALSSSAPSDYFNGKIYSVRIYNRALSASEVLQNYNSLAPDTTAPTFRNSTTFSIAENTATSTNAATITVNESSTITITSGTDSARFTLVTSDSVTARIRFAAIPNFEAPADVGTNNVYDISVRATDTAGNIANQSISITVTNVNEAPTITINSSNETHTITQAENISSVVTYTATDVDAATTLSFSLSGTDAADFAINSYSGALTFSSNPDFEAPADSDTNNSYIIIVTVSDGALTDTQTVTITITNANESASINAPTVSGTINKSVATTITVTINVAGKVRFFVGGKRISTCKDRTTSGTYPNNTATCSWRPAVTGRQILTATLTPTDNTFSASTSAPTTVQVVRRGTVR